MRPSNLTLLMRAVARRCPNCGARGIFASFTELRASCPICGLRLQRGESDYFIGAYLLNLVAVELLFAILLGVVAVVTYPDTPWVLLQWSSLVLVIAGAVICYPFAKAIWLAADLIFRPMTEKELNWHREGADADRELPHLCQRGGLGVFRGASQRLGKTDAAVRLRGRGRRPRAFRTPIARQVARPHAVPEPDSRALPLRKS